MSARTVLEIALRVLGFWFFLWGISYLVQMAVAVVRRGILAGEMDEILVSSTALVVWVFLGATFIICAPAIAGWFYPRDSERGEPHRPIGPGDIYHTASFLLGVYLLVAQSHPAGRLLSDAFARTWQRHDMIARAIPLLVHTCVGLLLVFGARPIAGLLANLRYDPNTIPQQRISIAMLLVVMVVIAAVLGIVRLMAS